MKLERIFTKPQAGGIQVEHESIEAVAGAGLRGDRFFDRHEEPGQNLSLIEAEEIEAFQIEQGRALNLSVTGRNLVTRGVRLNELVGREFSVGELKVRGVELCEPCVVLGAALASEQISEAVVVKRMLHKGGLRVDVLTSGKIRCGDEIRS